MAIWLFNRACPSCREQGKDTTGDNLGVYNDGSLHCWSCGYHKGPDTYVPTNLDETEDEVVLPQLEKVLPRDNWEYLRLFLDPEQIDKHYKWAPVLKRHVFHYKDGDNLYWEGRGLAVQPKYLSRGKKPFFVLPKEGSDTLVITEDLLSALRVNKTANAMPLFGSFCPNKWLLRLSKMTHIKRYIWWLDWDKRDVALRYNRLLGTLANATSRKCGVIFTEFDPKSYNDGYVRKFLRTDEGGIAGLDSDLP